MFTVEEREKMGRFLQIGMTDVFRDRCAEGNHYTWWPYAYNARERNVGWRLDYIFVSNSLKERVRKVEILENEMGSDHCPVLLDIDMAE